MVGRLAHHRPISASSTFGDFGCWSLLGYELWRKDSKRRPAYMMEAYYADPALPRADVDRT